MDSQEPKIRQYQLENILIMDMGEKTPSQHVLTKEQDQSVIGKSRHSSQIWQGDQNSDLGNSQQKSFSCLQDDRRSFSQITNTNPTQTEFPEESQMFPVAQKFNEMVIDLRFNRAAIMERVQYFTSEELFQISLSLIQKPPVDRTYIDLLVIQKAFEEIEFFKNFLIDFGQQSLLTCFRCLRLEQLKTDQILFQQGDMGDQFYVVLRGKIFLYANQQKQVTLNTPTNTDRTKPKKIQKQQFPLGIQEDYVFLGEIQSGQSFGELAILNSSCRTASAITESVPTYLAVLSKKDYQVTVASAHRQIFQQNTEFLASIPVFENMSRRGLQGMLQSFETVQFKFREFVFKEGDKSDDIYIVIQGEFQITQLMKINYPKESGSYQLDMDFVQNFIPSQSHPIRLLDMAVVGKGQILGDYQAMNGIIRTCNVECLSSSGQTFRISLPELKKKAEMMGEVEMLRRLEKFTTQKSRWHNSLLHVVQNTNNNYKQLLTKPDVSDQQNYIIQPTKKPSAQPNDAVSTLNQITQNTIYNDLEFKTKQMNNTVEDTLQIGDDDHHYRTRLHNTTLDDAHQKQHSLHFQINRTQENNSFYLTNLGKYQNNLQTKKDREQNPTASMSFDAESKPPMTAATSINLNRFNTTKSHFNMNLSSMRNSSRGVNSSRQNQFYNNSNSPGFSPREAKTANATKRSRNSNERDIKRELSLNDEPSIQSDRNSYNKGLINQSMSNQKVSVPILNLNMGRQTRSPEDLSNISQSGGPFHFKFGAPHLNQTNPQFKNTLLNENMGQHQVIDHDHNNNNPNILLTNSSNQMKTIFSNKFNQINISINNNNNSINKNNNHSNIININHNNSFLSDQQNQNGEQLSRDKFLNGQLPEGRNGRMPQIEEKRTQPPLSVLTSRQQDELLRNLNFIQKVVHTNRSYLKTSCQARPSSKLTNSSNMQRSPRQPILDSPNNQNQHLKQQMQNTSLNFYNGIVTSPKQTTSQKPKKATEIEVSKPFGQAVKKVRKQHDFSLDETQEDASQKLMDQTVVGMKMNLIWKMTKVSANAYPDRPFTSQKKNIQGPETTEEVNEAKRFLEQQAGQSPNQQNFVPNIVFNIKDILYPEKQKPVFQPTSVRDAFQVQHEQSSCFRIFEKQKSKRRVRVRNTNNYIDTQSFINFVNMSQ